MKHKTSKRIASLFLCLVMLFSVVCAADIFPTAAATGTKVLLVTGSDFQDPDTSYSSGSGASGYDDQTARIETIMSQITSYYSSETLTAKGFIAGGDYQYDSSSSSSTNITYTNTGTNYVKQSVQTVLGNDTDMIFVEGNHDSMGTNIAAFGNNDTDYYGVFVINEDNYESKPSSSTATAATATALNTYLADKLANEYSKPIFVVSHVPLHYSTRTAKEKDAAYAYRIYNVLKDYGDDLNIIFLFGHDHAWSDDDYLGGGSVYLEAGDPMRIAGASVDSSGNVVPTATETSNYNSQTEVTLNFTYMNYGYTGYYWSSWSNRSYTGSADNTLTMTSFLIEEDQVTICRWDESGMHTYLKAAGADSPGLRPQAETCSDYSYKSATYTPPQVLTLKTFTPYATMNDPTTGISVYAKGTVLSVGENSHDYTISGYEDFRSYDLEVTNLEAGSTATVTIPLPSGYTDEGYTAEVYQEVSYGNRVKLDATIENGSIVFDTDSLGTFYVAKVEYVAPVIPDDPDDPSLADLTWVEIPGEPGGWQPTVTLADGDTLIIKNYSSDYYLQNTSSNSRLVLAQPTAGDDDYSNIIRWTAHANDDYWYLSDPNGQYLNMSGNNSSLSDYVVPLQITAVSGKENASQIGLMPATTVSYTTGGYSAYQNGSYYIACSDGNFHIVSTISCTRSGTTGNRRYSWNVTCADGASYTTSASTNSSIALYTLTGTASVFLYEYTSSRDGEVARSNGTTGASSDINAWVFYKQGTPVAGGWTALDAEALTFPIETLTAEEVEQAVRDNITVYFAEDDDGVDLDTAAAVSDYTLTANGTVDPDTVGSATYTVTYEEQTVGTVTVNFREAQITGYSLKYGVGSVTRGTADSTVAIGEKIVVSYEGGITTEIPVTLDMVSGDFNVDETGIYTDLVVTYGDETFNNFTLEVITNAGENDYPEYPFEGSVRVDKNLDTSENNWFDTGVAEIELTATGVPMMPGADVIFMLDTSSSMTKNKTDEGQETRLVVMKNALQLMVDELSGSDANESIRIAIADFNGYGTIDANDKLTSSVQSATNSGGVYTGSAAIDAGAFVAPDQITSTLINSIEASSGTNYDYAFDTTYRLGAAIKAQNIAEGNPNRPLYVIFMSDGCSFQYNYYMTKSDFNNEVNATGGPTTDWNAWLLGTFDTSNTVAEWTASTHKYFYNPALAADGVTHIQKHWMAEAIKGSADEVYPVIDPTRSMGTDASADYGDYFRYVDGLGATMYTIGFCLEDDQSSHTKGVVAETTDHNVHYLASVDENGSYLYQSATTASELESGFLQVFTDIKYAATQAYFVDQMGDDFKLQMANYVTRGNDGAQISLTSSPTIKVLRYDLYLASEVGTTVDGVTVTTDMVGTRKPGSPFPLEIVSFNSDGTAAYSNMMSGSDNLLVDGVITAKTFWYNTTDSAKTITLADGTTYQLPANSFYWKIGTLNESEVCLNYYVYLRGSMEGTREPGSYETNNYADLHYVNYLDHNAVKHTVSPTLPWKNATISYAFYLVDSNGNPVVNQTTGETGSFPNAVRLTNPVVYTEVELNSSASVSPEIVAADVIPEGYSLYDPDAAYSVLINSDGTGSWEITRNASPATTYVTSYGGDPTTQLIMNDGTKDYTHTVVWFAVRYDIGPVPDVVVIDYGLYVDINVLANDIFGDKGTLVDVGAAQPEGSYTATLNAGFGNTLTTDHGTATVKNGKVRYTPKDMQMDEVDVFSYAARYESSVGEIRYFYSTVTVVPAANMYFEQDFVSFTGAGWIDVGTAGTAGQSEDRPGAYSLAEYDANNVYGYDPTYSECTAYSYGAAKKVTVSQDYYDTNEAWPNATFTFTGSRFDLISLTSKETGFIRVEVFEGTDTTATPLQKWAVNTYYGFAATTDAEFPWVKTTYTYNAAKDKWISENELVAVEGNDGVTDVPTNPEDGDTFVMYRPNYVWTPSATNTALYEVPVIRSTDLGYGTYTVVVTPCYAPFFDQTGEGSYDFYLDSVRIYGPAQGVDDYYVQDDEGWPEYIHIRKNLLDQTAFATSASNIDGAVFIDGFSTLGEIDQYNNYGPNNEIYLRQNQAVAFTLEAQDASKVASVQIGMKSLNGGLASVEIVGLSGDGSLQKNSRIATATEMFYKIGNCVVWDKETDTSDIIIVRNTADSILSLTNVKVTYSSNPAAETRMCMSLSNATLAADYVQRIALSEMEACEHIYSVSVTANPTANAQGEAIVRCSKCAFTETVVLPSFTEGDYTYQRIAEPTCTGKGTDTYTIEAAPYGDAVVTVSTPANGHVYEEASAIYHTRGYVTRTCAICGQTLAFEDFELPETENSELEIESAALTLSDNINVVYAVNIPAGYTNPYMVFTMNGADIAVTEYTVNEQGQCCFEFTNVTPQHMGDNITAVLYANNGDEVYSDTVGNYSIKQYCVNQLSRYADDEAFVTLLSDLLVYGAAAQQYVGYNTDALITDGLTLTPSNDAIDCSSKISFSGSRDDSADWKSASLVLKNTLAIRFTFAAEDIEGLEIQATLNGRTQIFGKNDFKPVANQDNIWYIDFSGICAAEFDDAVTAVFYRDGAQIGRTVSYSVNTYIAAVQGNTAIPYLSELLVALYHYGMSAGRFANGSAD